MLVEHLNLPDRVTLRDQVAFNVVKVKPGSTDHAKLHKLLLAVTLCNDLSLFATRDHHNLCECLVSDDLLVFVVF